MPGQLSQCSDWVMGWMTEVQFLAGVGKGNFLIASVSKPALGPTQPPPQWVPWVKQIHLHSLICLLVWCLV